MNSKVAKLLAVSLYGMDGRTHKTMTLFLQGPCKGVAKIVDELDADVDIIDGDAMDAKSILDHCLAREPLRPIIILSLEQLKIEQTIYVQKPANTDNMLAAFKEARGCLDGKKKKKPPLIKPNADIKQESVPDTASVKPAKKPTVELELSAEKKVFINHLELNTTEKHKAAQMISENKFAGFIGLVPGIDFDDPKQSQAASYNPKQYYQGYVQSAIKVATGKAKVIKLNSGWKPLIILPHSHEIWLNADDNQLRSFAGVLVSTMSATDKAVMTLSAVNPKKESFSIESDKFQQMNTFLWKLACWTSKGRYPVNIDLSTPVYLKSWPNFTRLVVTPHALQISALLITGPRSINDIIQVLKIKPQYVFIFISAAYATGLLGPCTRQSDLIVEQEIPPVVVKQKQGLLSRIINRLRG